GEASRLSGLAVAKAPKALSLSKIHDLARGYDVVLCDGPPRLSDITRAAAVAADVVLVPLRAGGLDWWAVSETLELLDSADTIRAALGHPPVRRVFALNAVPAQHTNLKCNAVEAVAGLGDRAPIVVSNRVGFAEAVLSGESPLTVQPSGAAAAEIRLLYAAVLGRTDAH
ncbi:MAG: AAA family ATPase, partial [Byssovorax sp.]